MPYLDSVIHQEADVCFPTQVTSTLHCFHLKQDSLAASVDSCWPCLSIHLNFALFVAKALSDHRALQIFSHVPVSKESNVK